MDEAIMQVAEEFGFKPKSIRKSKYMYICRRDNAVRALKPVNADSKKLILIASLKEHLCSNGFRHIDRYYYSPDGFPYVVYGGSTYVMTDWFGGDEADFSSRDGIIDIVKASAQMHKSSIDFKADGSQLYCTDILENFEKSYKRLVSIKKIVDKQKKYSDFDIKFIKSYEQSRAAAQEALEIIGRSPVKQLKAEAREHGLFCHNSLKEENILMGKQPYIINFEDLSFDHFIFDLGELIERYIRKNDSGELHPINKILDTYMGINSFAEEYISVLYAYLRFPMRYIKVCSDFYQKKRSWTPNAALQRFDRLILKAEENERYILPLLEYGKTFKTGLQQEYGN